MSEKRVLLLLCGSFSPITIAHINLLSCARDHLAAEHRTRNGPAAVPLGLRAIISPVHDDYQKPGLAPAANRIAMAELLLLELRDAGRLGELQVEVDAWEAQRTRHSRTHEVVDHVQGVNGDSTDAPQVYLVCGEDMVRGMAVMELWPHESVQQLISKVSKLLVVPRAIPTDRNHDALATWITEWEFGANVVILRKATQPDVSSTAVRDMVARGERIRSLVGTRVEMFISVNRLYQPTCVDTSESFS